MRLSFRTAHPGEFARSFDARCEAFAYPADLRSKVPALWDNWLRQQVMTAHAIEDLDRGRMSVVGIGACVFVQDDFIAGCRAQGRPYLRAELVRRALAGEPVVLTPERMRAAQQSGGLTLFFLSDPVSGQGLTDEQQLLVDAKWGEALYELRGCAIKCLWHEVYGEHALRRSQGCGQLLIEDWAAYWKSGHTPAGGAEHRPYLMGVSREQAARQPGTHASYLFMHVPPQFGFSVRQQELLREALQGATDEELASLLNITASAVKKRWISVYDRVSTAVPGWLDGAAGRPHARGAEKRRHLLNYLRQHPEELHPACAVAD